MASRPVIPLLFLLLLSFTAGDGAAIFTIINWCPSTVYVASSSGGLGVGLPRGDTLHYGATAGSSGRIWGRTGCTFDADGRGACETGDCAGELVCKLSGKPPSTLAEFTLGDTVDYYDISVVDGFNVPMHFGCNSGPGLRCIDPSCPDANHRPDEGKIHTCKTNSSYYIVFCPA